MKAAYGDAVKITIVENIPEGPDADRIMEQGRGRREQGPDRRFLRIPERRDADRQSAIPRSRSCMLRASWSPELLAFAAKYFQGTYLMGMAAAALSKSGKLGSVSAFCHSGTHHIDSTPSPLVRRR